MPNIGDWTNTMSGYTTCNTITYNTVTETSILLPNHCCSFIPSLVPTYPWSYSWSSTPTYPWSYSWSSTPTYNIYVGYNSVELDTKKFVEKKLRREWRYKELK